MPKRKRPPSWSKRALHRVEAMLLHLLFAPARLLSLDAASATGGWIARTVGPLLPVSNVARRNLRRAFPELPAAAVERILVGVWDNLGRTLAEYPHLQEIWDFRPDDPERGRIQVVGAEEFVAMRDDGKPALIFSAHLGNWEVTAVGAHHHGLDLAVLFRPPNNPYAGQLVRRVRGPAMGELIETGRGGAVGAVRALEEGKHLGMLVDQRFDRGVRVPFFGRPAPTPTVLARLARRFDCPVHGARVERLGGARFRITLTPPLDLPRSGDEQADIQAIMTAVTAVVEDWVRDRPEQWLWLHRRWRD